MLVGFCKLIMSACNVGVTFFSFLLLSTMMHKPANRKSMIETLKRKVKELEEEEFLSSVVRYATCPWKKQAIKDSGLLQLPWSNHIRNGRYDADSALWTQDHLDQHTEAAVSLSAMCKALRQTLETTKTQQKRSMTSYLRDILGNQGVHMVLVQNGIVDTRYTCNVVEFVLLIARLWLAPSEAASVWHTESVHQMVTFLTVVKAEDWVSEALAGHIETRLMFHASPPPSWMSNFIKQLLPRVSAKQVITLSQLPWHDDVLGGVYTMSTPLVQGNTTTIKAIASQFSDASAQALTRSPQIIQLLGQLGLPPTTAVVRVILRLSQDGTEPDRTEEPWAEVSVAHATFDDPLSRKINRVKASMTADLTPCGPGCK